MTPSRTPTWLGGRSIDERHGQVTLRSDLPDFPWPPTDTVDQMARRLGRITA
ncbi:hypothetical protein ACFV0O_32585 [Kitasatospora sp. NPDC059577]|uniref:hypothetical protein n=1 Tax=Kitasatospora sp. NPDC059577 TaxID=3346873 RepID=UPI0036A10A6A